MQPKDNSRVGVYILDDHQMLIDGIKALLAHSKKYEVVGEETDGVIALKKIQEINPQLVITDINMPSMSGIEFTKALRTINSEIKICALSMHSEKAMIAQIMHSGANGYVLKNTGKQELLDALDKIMDGHYFISNNISIDLLFGENQTNKSLAAENNFKLTERENEILKLIAQENSNLSIANKLFISERTVETHRKNIFRKTNTKSVVGLIKYAFEHQLI
jgi:two-component system nitrate/nitrite response regulator NarL